MNFLGLDIGTTQMKCGIYNEAGELLYSDLTDYGTKQWTRGSYIDTEVIFERTVDMLARAYSAVPFGSVAISSLGESFVLLDGNDSLLFPPMLYTDTRGEREAEALSAYSDKIFSISGVVPQGMYSAYKLLWIKNNEPEIYARAEKLLLVGEYIGYLLSGVRAIDYSLAARSGIFDVREKEFSRELCELFGIEPSLFSPAVPSGSVIAPIKASIRSRIGADEDILVIAGGHDQVCAAIGAGAIEEGICADGMGTVECLTAVYQEPMDDPFMGRCGYPNVPHGLEGLWCTYLLNYSCGSLVSWWLDTLRSAAKEPMSSKELYAAYESDTYDTPTGLLVLPYFAGAATPYQNINAKGAILNLEVTDSAAKIHQGILEGLCMEMKLNLELTQKYGVRPKKIIATGGGSRSSVWLQLKADIMELPIYPLKVKEAGICGAAILSAATLLGEEVSSVASRFVTLDTPFLPRPEVSERFKPIYEKYKKLYDTLKEFN